jgi:hypothetical protein
MNGALEIDCVVLRFQRICHGLTMNVTFSSSKDIGSVCG